MSADRGLLSSLCLLCALGAPISAIAQSPRSVSPEQLRQLLLLPAPTPRVPETKPDAEAEPQRGTEFYSEAKVPADDAPTRDLLDYWQRWASSSANDAPKPSAVVRERLLAACEATPEILRAFLPLFSEVPATADRVKKLYDEAPSNEQFDREWHKTVRQWLMFHSKYFLNDLLALASKATDKDGYVSDEASLKALVKVDWSTAEPLLHSLVAGNQVRTAAVALTLLYQHAHDSKESDVEERYRVRLQAIVADRQAPARARDTALEVLSLTKWPGRDEWYLSLFEDDTLIDPHDGNTGFNPLQTLFAQDPEHWIPIMTRLVEGKNQTVRDGAASCLIIFQNKDARKDALQPLLPWLSNPEWARDHRDHRLRLVQSMEEIDLPESVPGLIWVVEHDEAEYKRSYAAESLARYKDPRAGPVLRKALFDEQDEDHRQRLIKGLINSGGLSEREQVDALEAYAARGLTPAGRAELDNHGYGPDVLPLPLSIGIYLASLKDVPGSLLPAVLTRAKSLTRKNPPLAKALLEVTHRWQGRQVDLDIVNRIAAGTADANMIANALERRIKLRESVGLELQALAGGGGAAPGIAAALLEDDNLAQALVGSENQEGQVALLACARLIQMPLSVEPVGALMQSKDPLLALAAERYLLAEDSKESQRLLWARHPDEAFVTGWRENIPLLSGDNFDVMGKTEEKLRKELFTDGPALEIFALVFNSEDYGQVLRIYADGAVYTHYQDSARYRERVISKEELAAFKSFVATNDLTELGPQFGSCHHDCSLSEFLSLTRQRGRRVFSHQGFSGWLTLYANFDLLGQGEGAKTHYKLEKEIKGLEVLYESKTLTVKDVWQQGADIRIYVELEETIEQMLAQREADAELEDEDREKALADRRQRELARYKSRFSWRALKGDKAGAVVSQPEGYSSFDESKFELEEKYSSYFNENRSRAVAGKFIVLANNFDGLWKQEIGGKAVKISGEGAYANPVTTPDGKWAVVAKADNNWGLPNYVVRFNLQTGREFRVDIPSADQFDPVAYVSVHGQVLLRRAKDDDGPLKKNNVGPETPEYYLLDAATGQTRLAPGVFTPLREQGKRFLQPTGKPDEFWAAIPKAGNQTEVGRYNLKDFSFHPVMRIPDLSFESTSMWVDEGGAKLYIVYGGQLLRLPLASTR